MHKAKRSAFLITVDIPEGCTTKEMKDYIEEAVTTWHGSMDPEHPLFNLDGDSVRVEDC